MEKWPKSTFKRTFYKMTTLSFMTFYNSTTSHNVVTEDVENATDEYYYNYEDAVNNVPLDELVPNALGYGLTLLLGLVGNTLVIVSVARYRRMQNVTNIFLLSLATADLLLVLICVPVKIAKFFTFTWTFGEFLCKGVHYLQNVVIICSVANLTGLSLERYYAILHPMRAKYTCTVALARRTVLILWVLSIIMGVPILIGQQHILVGSRRKGYWCMEQWDLPIYHQLYQIYMFFLIFLLPLTLMTFAYASICRKLWLVRYHRASIRANNLRYSCQETILLNGDTTPGALRRDKIVPSAFTVRRKKLFAADEDSTRKQFTFQVIKMLVAVIVLFAACWGPIMVNNLLVSFGVLEQLSLGYLKPMRQAFWLMSYFNSCVNPIVYGFMSKNFRDTFRYTIGLCCLRRTPNRMMVLQGRCSLPSGQSTSMRAASMYEADRWNIYRCSRMNISHGSPTTEMTDLRKCAELKTPVNLTLNGHICTKPSHDVCHLP
ncbi:QRFP-like peptide receptor isoform X2 [Haliotis cracherodii]|uniref:QRFP-like peptide receptor isoform X2 n=1 Tax=Haliotis cracherodii TaxID=6455 RepID=UPI0039E9088B